MGEEDFVEAILAEPDSEAVALVYADWLEDRGDPRGEYLRLEIERLTLPVHSKRHTQVHERLHALRRAFDSRWAVDVAFRRIQTVDDLTYYLRDYFKQGKTRRPALRKNLPRSLAIIYRELHFLFGSGSFGKTDYLFACKELDESDDGMIRFLNENQGCWSCWFPSGQEDPPVYATSGEDDGFREVCDSLEHFLITFCLQEAVFTAPFNFAIDEGQVYRGKQAGEILTVPCRSLWLDGKYVSDADDFTSNFYDVPRQGAWIVDSGHGMFLGARDGKASRLIRKGVEYSSLHRDQR